jgi:hypothetical protein
MLQIAQTLDSHEDDVQHLVVKKPDHNSDQDGDEFIVHGIPPPFKTFRGLMVDRRKPVNKPNGSKEDDREENGACFFIHVPNLH